MSRKPNPANPATMICEVCNHPVSRHAPAEGGNVHYCTICKKECDFEWQEESEGRQWQFNSLSEHNFVPLSRYIVRYCSKKHWEKKNGISSLDAYVWKWSNADSQFALDLADLGGVLSHLAVIALHLCDSVSRPCLSQRAPTLSGRKVVAFPSC